MTLADWNIPVKDFACKEHSAVCGVSKLAKWPYDKIPVAFAVKNVIKTKNKKLGKGMYVS